MSLQATELRQSRRAWAAAGSNHDRLIALLRIALPAAIGVLTAFLALAPLTGRDISFVLSKDRVDVAGERMRVTRAVYRGRDGKGQPFRLDAASAVQANSRDPIVRLQTLNARIQLADGPATIDAGRGRYDMDTRRIAIDGPVTMTQSDGYRVLTRDILFDLESKRGISRGPVDGTMTLGRFSADRLATNLETRVVNLDGRARCISSSRKPERDDDPPVAPFLPALALTSIAAAQGLSLMKGHDSNAPVDVTSDHIELQDRADRAIFTGKVHVVQGDMTMDAARMNVAYAKPPPGKTGDPQIQRIDASGGVTVVGPGERARGSFGIYDLNRRLITLIGGVSLTRNGNTINGARLVMDLESGRSTVDGSAVGGAPGTTRSSGGRVTGRFTVPQKTTTPSITPSPPAK